MPDKWTGVNDGDPWTLEVDTDCFNPDEGAGHLRVGERHVPGARVSLTRAGARSRTRFDALRRADRGGA